LNVLYETGYSAEDLCAIGVKIGADVPFCIRQGIAVTRGIGERFTEAPRLPDCTIVVACAGEGVSTPWAYGRLDEMYDFAARTVDADIFTRVIAGGRLCDITAAMTNIFESAVLPVRPQAVSIKENLLKSGALGALMSGSGPSVFGIFDNPESADLAVRQLNSLGIAAQCCKPYYPGEN
jgi:4-diphosphocytidyl-2-C-methyl-D-erythritol kinase